MKFEELRTFVSVVEAGSFAAASEQLGLAKSAVSRRVRDLEIRLGTPLIHRSTRRSHLTDAGQDFYERGARILSELAEAESAVSSDNGELRGRLRITVSASLMTHCLARLIGRFTDANPHLSVEVDTDNRIVDIIREGFDLAIRISRLRDSNLIARRIATVRHVCCASPALLERYGRPKQPDDLAAMPGIRYLVVEESRYWSFAGGRSPAVKSRLAFTNGEAIREAAIAGLGVAVLPTFIVHDAIRRGDLEVILRDHIRPPMGMFAVYPSKNMPPRLHAFVEFLAGYFGNAPSWDRDILMREELRRVS